MFRSPFSICCPFRAGADNLALSGANVAAGSGVEKSAALRGGFGMKRNANEKYSGRQRGGWPGRGEQGAKNADLAAGLAAGRSAIAIAD